MNNFFIVCSIHYPNSEGYRSGIFKNVAPSLSVAVELFSAFASGLEACDIRLVVSSVTTLKPRGASPISIFEPEQVKEAIFGPTQSA